MANAFLVREAEMRRRVAEAGMTWTQWQRKLSAGAQSAMAAVDAAKAEAADQGRQLSPAEVGRIATEAFE